MMGSNDIAGAAGSFRQAVAQRSRVGGRSSGSGVGLGASGDLKGAVAKLSRAVALRPDPRGHPIQSWGCPLVCRGKIPSRGGTLWPRRSGSTRLTALPPACAALPTVTRATFAAARACCQRSRGDPAHPARMFYFDLGIVFLRKNDLPHALGQFEAGLNLPSAGRSSAGSGRGDQRIEARQWRSRSGRGAVSAWAGCSGLGGAEARVRHRGVGIGRAS